MLIKESFLPKTEKEDRIVSITGHSVGVCHCKFDTKDGPLQGSMPAMYLARYIV